MKAITVTSQHASYLAKVASGKRAEDIAKEEHVSVPTVRYHLNGLRASMDAETLPQLVAKAITQNVIEPDGQGGFEATKSPQKDLRRGHIK
jgi:DNA-binding CsgD family transcriptional regulator